MKEFVNLLNLLTIDEKLNDDCFDCIDIDIDIKPSPSPSLNNTFELIRIEFDNYQNQFKTIKEIRTTYPETIDLLLLTKDGGQEPVHCYYFALLAPKLWQQLTTINNFNSDNKNNKNLSNIQKTLLIPDELIINDSILLKTLCNSMYQLNEQIEYSIALKLLPIGEKFQLDFLLNDCFRSLHSLISQSNCILLWQIGLHFYQHGTLAKKLCQCSYRFILNNIIKILHSNHLMISDTIKLLSIQQLKIIIDDNRLNISNEWQIWYLIKKWIQFNLDELDYFWSLFAKIRWNQIDPRLIYEKIIPDLLTFDQNQCNRQLSEHFKYQKSILNIDLRTFRPRIPTQLLFIYGGFDNGYPSSTIKTFDIRSHRWFQFRLNNDDDDHFDYPRVYHQTVNIGCKMYVIGGSDGINCLNTVISIDLSNGHYQECCSMIEQRSFHCAIVYHNRYIIVCGGYNGHQRLRTVEMYDCRKNCWQYLSPMQTIRSDASAILYNNCIYVAGGVSDYSQTLNSMEYYSFVNNQWTIISFMHIQRRCFSLINYNSFIYAIGGSTEIFEFNCLKSVERYNPKTNTWYFAPSLPKHRMSTSVAILNDQIYLFGGYDGFTTYRTIFTYHFKQSNWQQSSSYDRLPVHLSGTTSTVIIDDSMMDTIHYSYYGNICNHQNCFNQKIKFRNHHYLKNGKKFIKFIEKYLQYDK